MKAEPVGSELRPIRPEAASIRGLYVRKPADLGALELESTAWPSLTLSHQHDAEKWYENVLAAGRWIKPKALAGIETLHCTLFLPLLYAFRQPETG